MAIKTQEIFNPLYTNKDKFIILVTGGRGSSKSYNITTFAERLSFEKGHKILFSRYTMTSAKISIIPEFQEKIEKEGVQNHFIISNNEIINKFSQSSIIFKGIKTSSGNQTANLKSIQGITTFIGDEMEEWESEDDYEKLILSIRQKHAQLRVILILNPSNAEHFIYKKYIADNHKIVNIDGVDVQISTHPDVLHIHSSYLDNLENLSPQFLNVVESIKKESIIQCTVNGVLDKVLFNKSKYAEKIIGRWSDIAEGVIFTNWKDGEFETSLPYCYGQDYGFSLDPDTLVKVAIDHKRKIIYAEEKYYGRHQLSTDDLYLLNKSLIDNENDLIIGDSAEPRLIEDLRKKGLNIKGTKKKPGIVSASIIQMLDYEIVVCGDSSNLKKELRNYTWSNKKAGIPKGGNDHCFTGRTLITTNKGQKPIKSIKKGDLVLTSEGYKKVNKKFNNGCRKILIIKLKFHTFEVILEGTSDHKIKTSKGWKQLKEIEAGDMLYIPKNQSKNLTGKYSQNIKARDISQKEIEDCTELYGNSTTEKYQRDFIYTIKTAIAKITQFPIWNVFPQSSITRNTSKKEVKEGEAKNKLNTSLKLEKKQKNGTPAKKVESGIATIGKTHLQKLLLKENLIVSNAVGSLRQRIHENTKDFAAIHANQNGEGIMDWMMKLESAKLVRKNLQPTNIPKYDFVQEVVVEKVQLLNETEERVYDLEVEECHEYFASGILVHNCIDSLRYAFLELAEPVRNDLQRIASLI